MQITKASLQTARGKIQRALDEVGKELGLRFELGRITFNETSFRGKLEARRTDIEHTSNDSDEESSSVVNVNELNCLGRRVRADFDVLKLFVIGGHPHRIVGYNARRHKYPWSLERVPSGRKMKAGDIHIRYAGMQ